MTRIRTRTGLAALLALLPLPLHAQRPAPSAGVSDAAPEGLARTLRDLEREGARAVVRRDTVTLRRLEPRDAVFHYPDGTTGTGASDIAAVASGALVIDSLSLDSMRVLQVAPTVVLVAGRSVLRGRAQPPGGAAQDISGTYRFLDVWRRRGGQWQLAAGQATRIAGH